MPNGGNRYFCISRNGEGFLITSVKLRLTENYGKANYFLIPWSLQEGEQFVKKIGGIFAFKVKDGPGGKEATWVVDVKNGKGSVAVNSGQCSFIMSLQNTHKINELDSYSVQAVVTLSKNDVDMYQRFQWNNKMSVGKCVQVLAL